VRRQRRGCRKIADVEPPDLEPLAPEAMPRRGLRRGDGTPQNKTQRNFTDADTILMKSDRPLLQGTTASWRLDSDYR